MRKLTDIINALFPDVRITTIAETEDNTIEIFEDENGIWRFYKDNVVWGNFPTFEDARRTAEDYNYYKARKVEYASSNFQTSKS